MEQEQQNRTIPFTLNSPGKLLVAKKEVRLSRENREKSFPGFGRPVSPNLNYRLMEGEVVLLVNTICCRQNWKTESGNLFPLEATTARLALASNIKKTNEESKFIVFNGESNISNYDFIPVMNEYGFNRLSMNKYLTKVQLLHNETMLRMVWKSTSTGNFGLTNQLFIAAKWLYNHFDLAL